ncbi:MAG: leucine-rich repeat domain-containing protein, partial [Treponema sp.]|nr:leucine-rich repeat domain-containing protein [Treponema sp.]
MENGVNIDELRENLIKNNPVAREKDFKVVDYEDGVSLTRYKGKNGTLIIHGVSLTRYKGKNETLIIPEKINGKRVIAIHSRFFRKNNRKIKNIILPNGIKYIDDNAFNVPAFLPNTGGISDFEYIHLPESITSIGEGAFSTCRRLNKINIPESVISIGSNAFSDCYSLKKINIPESVTTIGRTAFPFGCEINISKENKNYSFCDGFLVDKTNEILV